MAIDKDRDEDRDKDGAVATGPQSGVAPYTLSLPKGRRIIGQIPSCRKANGDTRGGPALPA